MITDRDIAIRGIAEGKGPDTKAREVMSQEMKYCFEDEAVEHVAENMAELQVRRLPVLNRDKRLVGIVSLGDLATQARCRKRQGRCTGSRSPAGSTIRAKRPDDVPAAQKIRQGGVAPERCCADISRPRLMRRVVGQPSSVRRCHPVDEGEGNRYSHGGL